MTQHEEPIEFRNDYEQVVKEGNSINALQTLHRILSNHTLHTFLRYRLSGEKQNIGASTTLFDVDTSGLAANMLGPKSKLIYTPGGFILEEITDSAPNPQVKRIPKQIAFHYNDKQGMVADEVFLPDSSSLRLTLAESVAKPGDFAKKLAMFINTSK